MKNKLKQITDLTIKDVLQNEVILPSSYFKSFGENAKTFDVNLEETTNQNSNLEHSLDRLLSDEYNTIDEYMKTTIASVETLSVATKIAQVAIKNNDTKSLNKIQNSMLNLEQELLSLKDEIYKDSFTKTFNRKWIYKYLLDEDSKVKENGVFVLLHVKDFDYIKKEHNELIANNLIIYILNFLNKNFHKENIDFVNARFFHDTFLISIKEEERSSLNTLLLNIMQMIENTTLKSKSGIVIKPRFNFSTLEYHKNDNFKILLETLNQGLDE